MISAQATAPRATGSRSQGLTAIIELLLRAAGHMRAVPQRRRRPASQDAGHDGLPSAAEFASGSYLQRVRMLSRLSPAREVELVLRARSTALDDLQREAARREVIRANLWVVPVIVRRFYRQGSGFDDLVAEGNIGLYRAFERFDPHRGFRFSTYAKWWVVDAVTSAMAANAYPMRVPRKVAQALARRRRDEGGRAPDAPTGVTGGASDDGESALDAPSPQGLETGEPEPSAEDAAHAVSDVSTEQIVALREALHVLARAVQALPPRERRIVEGRFGLNGRAEETLQQIGDELGVTAERVRTLQIAAMQMLRRHFGEALAESVPARRGASSTR